MVNASVLPFFIGLLVISSITLKAVAENTDVSREVLLETRVASPVAVQKLVTQRIEMAPTVAGRKHFHPVPVIGYVVQGTIAFQIQGQPVQFLNAGDAFFEPADAVIVRWENVGPTRAVFVANYLVANPAEKLLIPLN